MWHRGKGKLEIEEMEVREYNNENLRPQDTVDRFKLMSELVSRTQEP